MDISFFIWLNKIYLDRNIRQAKKDALKNAPLKCQTLGQNMC